jgi:PE-PPE domain
MFAASNRIFGTKVAVLLAFVLVLFVGIPSTTAMAATALMVGGLGQSTLDDFTMRLALDGKFTGTDPVSGTPWKRVSVSWPAQMGPYFGDVSLKQSVDVGTANLVKAIRDTYKAKPGEPITVLGTSAGTLVVDEAMRVLANDPTAPPPSAINFVVMADGTQKHAGGDISSPWNPWATLSGYTYQAPPQTAYDVTVVTYEFDGWADFPDRWWNGVAVYNAIAGGLLLHAPTWVVDLATADTFRTESTNAAGGVTTTYLVRAETLPLVQLIPSLKPMEAALRQQVEAGYSRYDSVAGLQIASAKVAPLTDTAAETLADSALSGDTDVANVPAADELDITATEDTAAVEASGDDADRAIAEVDSPRITRSSANTRKTPGADTSGAATADNADGAVRTTKVKDRVTAGGTTGRSAPSEASAESESESESESAS